MLSRYLERMTTQTVASRPEASSPCRPVSKRFTRFDEAHAALGIKDEDDPDRESEIDKRLRDGISLVSNRGLNTASTLGGSTGSTFSNSSSTHSISTEGSSVYGGVVLRKVMHTSSSPPPTPSAASSATLPRRSFYSSTTEFSTLTLPRNRSNNNNPERGSGDGKGGKDVAAQPPSKPTRKKVAQKELLKKQLTENNIATGRSEQLPVFTRGYSMQITDTGTDKELLGKQGKRRRFTSADFLTRSVRVKGEKRRSSLKFTEEEEEGGEEDERKLRDRLSSFYSSMRIGKRRGSNRQNSAGSDMTSVSGSPTDAKSLRLLEETTCADPQKLLADRFRELRKVGDPGADKNSETETEDFPLFEFVCEVSLRWKGESYSPYVSWSHPPLRVLEEEKDKLASITLNIPTFCFPDLDIVEPVKKMKTETYCFVFTDLQAQNKFGYCRRFLPAAKSHPPEKRFPVVYCMVTKLRSFETFSKVFDQVVKLRDFSSAGAYSFLKSLIEQNAPKPGRSITVKYISPKIGNLVDIHVERLTDGQRYEHVDLAHVLTKLGSKLLVEIFVNLLVERKLLFVAESLSDLTSIIHSIMQLLYPLQWQGIYIPVLPQDILDATSSPVPFVIGILKQHVKSIDEESLDDECNLVHIADKKIVKRPNFTDIPFNKKYRKSFLLDLKSYKAKVLKSERSVSQTTEIGDMFFEFMRTIIGHYSDHVTFDEAGESDIDLQGFSDSAGVHAAFVWQLSKTQMFSSFIQSLKPDSPNPFVVKSADIG